MKSIVIPFNENNKIERVITLLQKLKIPFAVRESEKLDINDPTIAWDWQDIDEKVFSKISQPAFAEDWQNETDAVWDNL
jgi:hypothetical protein